MSKHVLFQLNVEHRYYCELVANVVYDNFKAQTFSEHKVPMAWIT